MQKAHESPVCLEQLLEVPLQVIRLEDILREKSSSVSPPSGVNRDDGENARLCRSVDSHPLTKNNGGIDRSDDDEPHKKSASAPCLFSCCTKGTSFNKTKFKTKALTLPDGSEAVVPVAQNGENLMAQKRNQLQYYNEILCSSENSFLRDKNEKRATPLPYHSPTVLPSPVTPPQPLPLLSPLNNQRKSLSPPQASVTNTLSQSSMPVVLGKVTERPTRYEDLLDLRPYSSNPVDAYLSSRKHQNGREDRERRESDKNTLKLTFYNDGRKGPVKEYRTHLDSETRYFENQQLQLSRVVRDRSQVLQPPRIPNFLNRPHDNDNTLESFNYANVNNATGSSPIAHPQLKLTSSIVKNVNSYNTPNNVTTNKNTSGLVHTANHTNKTANNGNPWNGLQISRCQKDEHAVIPMDGHRAAASGVHPNPMHIDGEEGEISVDGDLNNYLTDYRFLLKPAKARETGSESNDGNDQDKNKISVRYIIEQATAAGIREPSPSPPPAAQITRVPNVSIQSTSRAIDAWTERTIARVPLRGNARKNSAYEPTSLPLIPTTVAQPNLQPPPKRFRASLNSEGRSQTDMLLARQHYQQQQQQHTFVPRYPSQTSAATSKASNHIDQYNAGRNAPSMSYNNISYQQQHQTAYMHGVSSQHSPRALLPPQPPHHLANFVTTLTPSQQYHFKQAVIVAAASAANSGENFDAAEYSEKLRCIAELYGKQEFSWETLNDFYQKVCHTEALKHWGNRHHQSNNTHNMDQQNRNQMMHDEGNFDCDTMSQHQQHQLALRAMSAANMSSNFSGGKVQYIEPRMPSTAASHNKVPMNLSPSSVAQAALPLQIQNKYNHNSQQLHQLQQIHQRQYQIQQQLRYRGPVPKHQQQQKAHHAMLKANYEMTNSAHYRNAYNQHPSAAAGSSTSPALSPPNSTHQNAASATSGSGERNYHSPAVTMMVAGDARPANTLQDEMHYPVSIHRQALESVMKNNYRNSSNNRIKTPEVPNYFGTVNTDHRNIPQRNHGQLSANTTPQMPSQLHGQWPNWNRNDEQYNRGENDTDTINLSAKDTSYKSHHNQSVIRRANNSHQSPSLAPNEGRRRLSIMGNNADRLGQSESISRDIIRPIPIMPQNTSQDQYSVRISHDARSDPEQEGLPKRPSFDEILRNSKQSEQDRAPTCSPVPLVTGVREEVVASVSPSAVLSGRDSPPEDDQGDSRDRDDSVGSGTAGNGTWQYDHVMLLDKRIKTYMCKKCFETLKTEQEIRNHLFCKMLANHVQCHVCLQIITTDAYPAHLQVHGVKPPDTVQFDD